MHISRPYGNNTVASEESSIYQSFFILKNVIRSRVFSESEHDVYDIAGNPTMLNINPGK